MEAEEQEADKIAQFSSNTKVSCRWSREFNPCWILEIT